MSKYYKLQYKNPVSAIDYAKYIVEDLIIISNDLVYITVNGNACDKRWQEITRQQFIDETKYDEDIKQKQTKAIPQPSNADIAQLLSELQIDLIINWGGM